MIGLIGHIEHPDSTVELWMWHAIARSWDVDHVALVAREPQIPEILRVRRMSGFTTLAAAIDSFGDAARVYVEQEDQKPGDFVHGPFNLFEYHHPGAPAIYVFGPDHIGTEEHPGGGLHGIKQGGEWVFVPMGSETSGYAQHIASIVMFDRYRKVAERYWHPAGRKGDE